MMEFPAWRASSAPILLAIALLVLPAALARVDCEGIAAAQAQGERRGLLSGELPPLERIEFKDTEREPIEGLRLSRDETGGEIEFAQITRAPGKPVSIVIRPIPRAEIKSLVELPNDVWQSYLEQFNRIRFRSQIEARRMESIELKQADDGGGLWVFDGPYFRMECSTSDELMRHCVVRGDQIFRAYRQILPPAQSSQQPPRIRLLGSMGQYRDEVAKLGVSSLSPAVYLPGQNLVVAGSDFEGYAREFEAIGAQHRKIRASMKAQAIRLGQQLQREKAALLQAGHPPLKVNSEINRRLQALRRKQNQKLTDISRANMQNQVEFAAYSQEMFARLYHEAFHAYLDNYFCPEGSPGLPIWLEEGLAQVFESSRLDGDGHLRIDAPDPERLRRLQEDLSEEPLPLADLIAAGQREFRDEFESEQVKRRYLYAWGVVYYLLDQERLNEATLRELVEKDAATETLITDLFGGPVEAFEPAWQQAILAMRAESSANGP